MNRIIWMRIPTWLITSRSAAMTASPTPLMRRLRRCRSGASALKQETRNRNSAETAQKIMIRMNEEFQPKVCP